MTQVQFGWIAPIGNKVLPQQEEFLGKIRAALNTIAGHFDSVWLMCHHDAL
jgi:hypothetical protein